MTHLGAGPASAWPAGGPARRPLGEQALRAALVRPDRLWRSMRVAVTTGSTNADLIAEARRGAAEGMVLAAEVQTGGRGRLGRSWTSPPRAALTFSVLLRPVSVAPAARGWLPLLAGIAVASALRADAGVDAWLKWPNDVLVSDRKIAGILAEQASDAVVVGVGLNVTTRRAELPVDSATSLIVEGAACLNRDRLLDGVLRQLERRYLAWTGAAGGAGPAGGLREEYLRLCSTIGREVRVLMPGGQDLSGTASDVDDAGRLVVCAASGTASVSAGDVMHVR